MKSKNGLTSKQGRCFNVTEGIKFIMFPLEVMIPGTLILLWLLHFPRHSNTIAYRAIGIVQYGWIVYAIIALWALVSGEYKKSLLRIDEEGVSFCQGKLFYEYEWREVEYVYEQRRYIFVPLLGIKVSDRATPFMINMDGYLSTLLPIRIAFRHFSKGKTMYYTKRQWKEREQRNASTE